MFIQGGTQPFLSLIASHPCLRRDASPPGPRAVAVLWPAAPRCRTCAGCWLDKGKVSARFNMVSRNLTASRARVTHVVIFCSKNSVPLVPLIASSASLRVAYSINAYPWRGAAIREAAFDMIWPWRDLP